MGRHSKMDSEELGDDGRLPGVVDPPPAVVGGKPNPEHYRVRARNLNTIAEYHLYRGNGLPFNVESATNMLFKEAVLAGIDTTHLADIRTDEEKLSDWAALFQEDAEELWNRVDEDLVLMEKNTEAMLDHARDILKARAGDEPLEEWVKRQEKKEEEKFRRYERLKKMLDRIRRVRKVQTAARNPVPKWGTRNAIESNAWESTHTLRFMQYVSRSNMSTLREDSASKVFAYGRMHVRLSLDTWESRCGIEYSKGKIVKGGHPFKGVNLIAPPGHGKSDFVMHLIGLEICKKPTIQAVYLHASEDVAKEALGYIKNFFQGVTPSGKRTAALYPGVVIDPKQNNAYAFRLKVKEKLRNPTLRASGVMSARLGISTDFQVWDDVVPQSDREEPTSRERRFSRLSGTWLTRQRGQNTFIVNVGTIWHHDDAMSKMLDIGRKTGQFCNSIQCTGGPSSHPPFKPLWPEVFPARELRRRFEQMNSDRNLWAANYEANPIADDARLIRKLRLYDPLAQEHADFLSSAQFHISVDPSATNRETSDKAGIVYVAIGEVRRAGEDGSVVFETRMRILDAIEIHANQNEVVDRVAAYAMQRPVFQVHVETRGAFHATADTFQERYGLEVNRIDPKNKSKEIRLREVATLIDDSSNDYRAKVEFPGVEGPTGLEGDPRWGWLYTQFKDFGVTAHDHSLDATTQIVRWFNQQGLLVSGTGEASRTMARALANTGDSRILRFLKEAQERMEKRPAAVEELAWLSGRGNVE